MGMIYAMHCYGLTRNALKMTNTMFYMPTVMTVRTRVVVELNSDLVGSALPVLVGMLGACLV